MFPVVGPLAVPLGALAVATIFYGYRDYLVRLRSKERRLRERVAYMLWVAANGVSD
jgi:hypothetical protein